MRIDPERAVNRIMKIDPYLAPYAPDIKTYIESYDSVFESIRDGYRGLLSFASAHKYFGFHRRSGGVVFRDWLPGADEVYLIGDFNGWDHSSHPLTRLDGGIWEIYLNKKHGLEHGQHVKLWVVRNGQGFERLPAYINYAEPDPRTHVLCGIVYLPEKEFEWTDGGYFAKHRHSQPLIYEAHVGMAQEYEGIGSYREFADNVIPRIEKLGYNTIQLMAIAEHPYYASFGYQVTNFYAPAHWFGRPEDLKYLVNKAHAHNISVLMDLVHSHACPNVGEGLNLLDGTEDQYFLKGQAGYHSAWGTRVFDYSKKEVLRFLLSNLRYWIEEFHFDGFRFDGVTSMLYHDHALTSSFTDYGMYYSMNTNVDAITYLRLANELIHKINPCAVTITEDMSGMPGMCLPLSSGGVGFDFRLAMGVPDMWIKFIKEVPFENWDMQKLVYELTQKRPQEGSVGYCESHDQALVGDKTIIFRLADAEMYTGMEKNYHSPTIDNAIDYHKLIRLVTLATSGGGYLNFMGNEFGHPEWIDFPREGNNWSYKYARRQWSLADAPYLKYEWLKNFDSAMIHLAEDTNLLAGEQAKSLWTDDERKIISLSRGKLIFVFNFNHTYSEQRFFVHTHNTGAGAYRVVLSSDDVEFGGQGRINKQYIYHSAPVKGRGEGFEFYIPCRTAAVLEIIED